MGMNHISFITPLELATDNLFKCSYSMRHLSIFKQLEQMPDAFDFFYGIFLIELTSDKKPLGYGNQPSEEALQFIHRSDLSFNTGELIDYRADTGTGTDKNTYLEVNGFGLTGSEGVLPLHYSEQINRQHRLKNTALQDYFNMLNHRSISLFYRAWEKYRFPIQYTRTKRRSLKNSSLCSHQKGEQEDTFTRVLNSLLGMNKTASHENPTEHSFSKHASLFYAGILSRQHKSASDIEQVLSDYFDLPVTIDTFCGHWERLPVASQTCLPSTDRPQGLNNDLGGNMILGQQAWSVQNKITITIDCNDYDTFEDFNLDGSGYRACKELISLMLGPHISATLQLQAPRAVMPSLQLSCRHSGQPPARLGLNTLVNVKSAGREEQPALQNPLSIQLPMN